MPRSASRLLEADRFLPGNHFKYPSSSHRFISPHTPLMADVTCRITSQHTPYQSECMQTHSPQASSFSHPYKYPKNPPDFAFHEFYTLSGRNSSSLSHSKILSSPELFSKLQGFISFSICCKFQSCTAPVVDCPCHLVIIRRVVVLRLFNQLSLIGKIIIIV